MKKQIKEKLRSACEIEDRKARVAKVSKMLESVKYADETSRLEAVLSFSRSKLSESEIEFIANTLRPEYRSSKDEQVQRKGVF